MLSSLALLSLPLLSAAAVYPRHDDEHSHSVARRLPDSWYQRDDHPVHALFRRDGPTDGATYAQVGSPEWVSAYPAGPPASPDPTKMPVEWLNALNDALARGVIPNISVTTLADPVNGIPTYPSDLNATGPEVCSATYQCRIPGDVWDAPDGALGLSFDDGPLPPSDGLYAYLAEHNQTATHFMIGSNIIQYPTEFLKAFGQGDDIAVHTWTHPYMTTLSNEVVVAELGWTVQLIHNSTGGRVPRFWRPPYGDSDMRTRAIAKEVFGLTTVVWNQDTNDWSLSDSPPGTTAAKVNASLTQWLTGPKSPGLIILEHELSNQSVASFQAAYPMMLSTGWQVTSLAKLMGNGTSYQNAANDEGAVVPVGNILNAVNVTVPLSSSASAIITPTASAAKQATPAQASASASRVAKSSDALSMGPSVGLATAVAAALFGIMLCA